MGERVIGCLGFVGGLGTAVCGVPDPVCGVLPSAADLAYSMHGRRGKWAVAIAEAPAIGSRAIEKETENSDRRRH